MKRNDKSTIHGFTLVELLVVISIIAILAGILLPIFAAARQRGNDARDYANLHHLGLALQMYANDNNDMYPSGLSVVDPNLSPGMQENANTGLGWSGQLFSYAGYEDRLFQSPSDRTPSNGEHSGVSYGLNSNSAAHPGSDFTAPSKTVLLYELRNSTANAKDAHPRYFPSPLSPAGVGLSEDPPLPPVDSLKVCKNLPLPIGTVWTKNVCAAVSAVFGRPGWVNVALYDPTASVAQIYGNYGESVDPASPPPADIASLTALHNGFGLFLMADGHVQLLRPERVSPGFNAPESSCDQGSKRGYQDVMPQPAGCAAVALGSAAGTLFDDSTVSPDTVGLSNPTGFDATFSAK